MNLAGRYIYIGTLILVIVALAGLATAQNTINTVAGGKTNEGLATGTVVIYPTGVAVDQVGNLYIAAPEMGVVYKVNPAGNFTLIAGGGTGGDGPATEASLGYPTHVALDSTGRYLFIPEVYGFKVRRLDLQTGIITTVAGNGSGGFSGDGGVATEANLSYPYHVAVDKDGNFFIADEGNFRVRRVDALTGTITTVAGNGTLGFGCDYGLATSVSLTGRVALAIDPDGYLLIDDTDATCVRRLDVQSDMITTVVGGGMYPWDMTVDRAGNYFLADFSGFVMRWEAGTQTLGPYAGIGVESYSGDGGPATSAGVNYPQGIAVDPFGNVFVADSLNNRIRRIDAITQMITTVAGGGGGGDGGPATGAFLYRPAGMVADASGNLFLIDVGRIRRVDAETGVITTVAGNGSAVSSGDGSPAIAAGIINPQGVAVDGEGNVYVATTNDNWQRPPGAIRRIDAKTGVITTVAGSGWGFGGDGGPATGASLSSNRLAVAADAAGNLYIADTENYRIRRVDAQTGIINTVAGNGTPTFSGDGGPAVDAGMFPTAVAVDRDDNFFIADGNRVRRVDAKTGNINTVAGNGGYGSIGEGGPATDASLFSPADVKVDSAGNLYIADSWPGIVRRVDGETGIIVTVAGTPFVGPQPGLGDGGPATDASLSGPSGIALDGLGHLFIGDTYNYRARRVDLKSMVKISATTLAFDDQATGTASAAQTVTLTNSGGANLTINNVTLDGQFVQTNDCPVPPATLHPGSLCTITVAFKPLIGETLSGAITISDDAYDAPRTIQLSGTGFGPPVDTTPPAITCAAAPGWHADNVSIACTAADSGVGLANAGDASFSLSTSVAPGTETVNASSNSHQVCDKANNCAAAGPIAGIMIDRKAPAISVTVPTGAYTVNQAVTAQYSCADNGSGVGSCLGPVASGAALSTSSPGIYSFTVNAADNAGNSSSSSSSYTVSYGACILYDSTKAAKAGSTVPIKLQLCDANNHDVSAPTIVVHATSVVQISSSASYLVQDAGNANPDYDFRFDSTLGPSGGYVFNLKTSGLTTGTYGLTFTAGTDPTPHTAYFQIR
jgi:sugar lactone lactonase YvrE